MNLDNRENYHLLNKYINILLEWQTHINLISKSTVNDIWERHVKDSLQIKEFIKGTNQNIIDIGSGAGFPGIVLAISDKHNHYTLIESSFKKTTFLNFVKVKLKLLNTTIINDRIQNLLGKITCDYLIARGLTNIENLLIYSQDFLTYSSMGIFLKGENFEVELKNLKNKKLLNIFNIEKISSKVNNKSKIIIVKKKV